VGLHELVRLRLSPNPEGSLDAAPGLELQLVRRLELLAANLGETLVVKATIRKSPIGGENKNLPSAPVNSCGWCSRW
jgi:hypothetical protein